MPFDPTNAIAVVERPDGLLEKDNFNPTTAVPAEGIPFLSADRSPVKYNPPLTDQDRARAFVEYTYKSEGKDVPLGLKVDWALTSDRARANTAAVLNTIATLGAYPVVQGARGLADNPDNLPPAEAIKKGILSPESTKRITDPFMDPTAPEWMKTVQGLSEDIIAYGATGIVKGMAEKGLVVRDLSRRLDSAATKFAEDAVGSVTAEQGLATKEASGLANKIDKVKNGYINDALERLSATDSQTLKTGFQEFAESRSMVRMIADELNAGGVSVGASIKPVVGQSVSFASAEGKTLIGKISEIAGNRATIDMEGRQVVAMLSQLSVPEVTQATTPKEDIAAPAAQGPESFATAEEYVASKGTLIYHGSGIKFDAFNDSMRGTITGAKSAKGAIWFTDNQKVAKAYSVFAAETGPVKALLDKADAAEKIAQKTGKQSDWDKQEEFLRQAEELDTYEKANARRELADVKEAVLDKDLDMLEVDAGGKTPQELSDEGDIDSWLNEQIREAKKQKKDGLIIKNLDDAVGLYNAPSTHYAIFDSGKIKLKSQLLSEYEAAKKISAPIVEPEAKDAASSVISYVKDGKKYYTELSKDELNYLQDEVKNIPTPPEGESQIHLDAITPNLQKIGVKLSREEFVKGHSQAAGVFTGQEESLIKKIVEDVGGKFKALVKGENSLYGEDPTVYYDTPSGSTQVIKASEATPENIKAKIDSFEEKYKSLQSGKKPPLPPKPPAVSPGGEESNVSPRGIKLLRKKLESFAAGKERADFAREQLNEVDSLRNELKSSIRNYDDKRLAEELSAIPKYYKTTNKFASTADQVMQNLRDEYGMEFNSESDLADYLKTLEATKKGLETDIADNTPKMVKMKETTVVKKQLKAAEVAQREGQREMEKALDAEEKLSAKEKKAAFREGRKVEAEARKQRYFGSSVTPDQRKELYVLALKKGVIYVDYAGKSHDKLQGLIRYYKGASFDQLKEYISNLSGSPENPAKLFKLYGDINKDAEALKLINEERKDWQDITPIEVYTLDPARIVEKVAKQNLWDGNILADNTFNIIASADEAMFDRKVKELGDLDQNRNGVQAGSKASAEIMRKFEAKEPLTANEQKVVDFLRSKYDALISEANQMRELLGKKPIPYRKDYMTHIIESNLLRDFFQGNDQGMSSISEVQMDAIRHGDFSRGNMPFNQFAQKRLGDKTKYDAVGNYIRYLNTILREVYYTPAITHSRKFIEYALNKQPNAFKSLDRMLNDLRGKVSIVDQNLIGNIAGSYPVKWIRTHISRSALIGNINFWVMNLSNFTTSYPELGNYVNIGMAKFLGDKKWREFAFKNSKMLKGRAIDPDFMDQPIHTKLEEAVGSITNLIEYNNIGSTFVGAYHRAVEELGYSEQKAIEYADDISRRVQVGYKPYEVNAWMRSNSGKLMSQFQTWSFNAMNYILYDLGTANIPEDFASMFTKDKKSRTRWGAFLTLVVTSMLVNSVYKKLGLREPYQPGAALPSIAGMDVGKYGAIGPARIAKDVMASFTAKKASTRIRARQRVAGSVVPGGAQTVRFLQGKVFPEKDKKKTIKIGD